MVQDKIGMENFTEIAGKENINKLFYLYKNTEALSANRRTDKEKADRPRGFLWQRGRQNHKV